MSDVAAPAANQAPDYTSEPQQAVLTLIESLARAWPQGQTVAMLQQETGLSRDQVFRGLWNLQKADWADQLPTGWILSPHAAQVSERIRLALHRLHTTYLAA